MRLGTERLSASSRLAQRVTSSSDARQGRLGTRLAPGVSVQSHLSGFETDGILGFGRRLCRGFETLCVSFTLNVYFGYFLALFVGFSFIFTSALSNLIRSHE